MSSCQIHSFINEILTFMSDLTETPNQVGKVVIHTGFIDCLNSTVKGFFFFFAFCISDQVSKYLFPFGAPDGD